VWVIDPLRRNGHRLNEASSIDDIFREHDTAEKALQTTTAVDGTDIGRRVREELAKREVQRLVAEHLAEAKIDADGHRAMSGLDFLEHDLDSDPVWGGNEVLWAKGEGAVIAGPQGTGKSTLAQQLCLRRLGIIKSKLLGYTVATDDRPVLYLAMDRPPQIRRSLRRMVAMADEDARTVLRDRLVVWSGPVPLKANEAPKTFCEWVRRRGREPGLVIVDSLKDLVSGLIDDAHGIGFNDAMQMVLETLGCEFLTLHHQRKPTVGNSKPNKLADLYGNTWFTAGQGSVISLWGQPGDAAVELSHLKQPQEKVGPLTVNHSHFAGTSLSVDVPAQLLEHAMAWGGPFSAKAIARRVYGLADDQDLPEAQRSKVRRELDKLVRSGALKHEAGTSGGDGGGKKDALWSVA
jgi:energy-coupling factor transporter ATP-binding protein EcfA2